MSASRHDRALAVVESQVPAVAPASIAAVERLEFTQSQLDVLKNTYCAGASNDEFQLFVNVCQELVLNPFKAEIQAVMRTDSRTGKRSMLIMIRILGYRVLADRTGLYAGQEPIQWCGTDGAWKEVWLDATPPAAAKCTVYRADWRAPVTAICTYAEFVQKDREGKPSGQWRTMPAHMLGIRAESHALRRAFPGLDSTARDRLRGAAVLQLEGDDAIEVPGRPAAPLQVLNGEDVIPWAALPEGTSADQVQEFLDAFGNARSHAVLNNTYGEAQRQGLGPMLEAPYQDARRRLSEQQLERASAKTRAAQERVQSQVEAATARQQVVDLDGDDVVDSEPAPDDLDPDHASYLAFLDQLEAAPVRSALQVVWTSVAAAGMDGDPDLQAVYERRQCELSGNGSR